MALGAIGAELGAVYICVTIRAVFPHIREHRLQMASCAGNFFMHPTQRIPRGVMIEFGDGPNRGPTRAGVAILAGNVQYAVRTPAGLPLRIYHACGRQYQERDDERETDLEHPGNGCPQTR